VNRAVPPVVVTAVLLVVTLFVWLSRSGSIEALIPHDEISDLRASPAKYGNRPVRIKGVCTGSFALLGVGRFTVADGSGEISVVTHGVVPENGRVVVVSGRLRQGLKAFGFEALYLEAVPSP